MLVIIALVAVLDRLLAFPMTHVILAGVAAAAIGLSLQMGVRAARRAATSPFAVVVIAATFFAIFAFHLPLLAVVCVMAPVSVAVAFYRLRGGI
jgi:chromate transporter